jgi:ATP-dependent helicase/nuclease subunit B
MYATITLDEALRQARAGAAVVTASRRLARLLHERYNTLAAEQGQQAWVAAKILPWSAWIGQLWESALYAAGSGAAPVRLGKEPALALWERVIERSEGGDGLLQISATAAAAAEAWELMHSWRIDRASLEAHASEDTHAFLGWVREFESACAREGWIDETRLADYVAGRLPSLPLPARAVLAGFDEFTRQQNEFLEALGQAGCEVLYAAPGKGAAVAPRAVRAAFADRNAEVSAAARWARALLERGATNIGIVVRDLREVRPKVERAFEEVLDPAAVLPGSAARRLFNISAGPALASHPLAHAALRALELKLGPNDVRLVSRFLRSPFSGGARAEWTQRAALDAELRKLGGAEVLLSRIEALCARRDCPALGRTLAAWRRERGAVPERQRPAGWARTFSVLLAKLGWPGDRGLTSEEYQAVKAWRELLSEFAALETVLADIAYGEALDRLVRMACERMFQPEGEAAPVQILGVLETSGLGFDHLWIAGLDDESWPGPPKPTAFLPVAVQRARQIPHASPERELAFARMITDRLLGSAQEVVASYAVRDGDHEMGPSSLIRNLAETSLDLPTCPTYFQVVRDASALESLDDHTAPPVEEAVVAGGTRVFQFQAACPFRAFAELRLGAKPLEAPESGLNARERGTLLHMTLATVWGELKSHARLCALYGELQPLVRAAVLRALDALADRRGSPLPPRFAALEQKRLEARVLEWLAVERDRSPFTVVQPEGERHAELGGVRARVILDRVDRLDDGREVIIDYKAGRIKPHCWEGGRLDEPQLPLYAVTHEAPLAAVVFGKLRAGDIGFQGYQSGAGIPGAAPAALDEELAGWRGVLERLAAEFRAGAADVNPKEPGVCLHCGHAALCRIAEAEIATSALAGEEEDG